MLAAEYLTTLRLDGSLATPLFRQLYDAIKSGILAGKLQSATQLPPTRALSQFYAPQAEAPLRAGTPSRLLLGFASVPSADTQLGVTVLRELLSTSR